MPTPTSPHTLALDFVGRAGTCQGTLPDYIEGNWIFRDVLGLLGMGLGGEGGIRTHDTLARIPVFETGTFNRSATSPKRAFYQRRRSASRLDSLQTTHVGLQRCGNVHATVRALVVLQDRHQRAPHRKAGSVH